MSHTIQDMVQITPSALTPWQVMVLNAVLHHHGLEHWTPEHVPSLVSSACLRCHSVTVNADDQNRDIVVENFDLQCCGMTVVFHTALSLLPATVLPLGALN